MYRKDRVRWLKHADFILLDLICIQLAYVFAYGVSGYGAMRNILKIGFYRDFVVTVNHSIMVGSLAILYLFLLQKGQEFSHLTLMLTVFFYIILTYMVRELRKKQLRKQMEDRGKRRLYPYRNHLSICSTSYLPCLTGTALLFPGAHVAGQRAQRHH